MREKDNIGVLDTAIRSIVACILLALAFEQMFSLPVTIAFAAMGTALWVSCATGVCLIYRALGVDTYHLKF